NEPVRGPFVMSSHRISRDEAWDFYQGSLAVLGQAADEVRYRKHPDKIVTYSIQRTVNYTNICNAYCSFCSFYRAPGHAEGYVMSDEQIMRKIEESIALGATGIFIQGGDHPDLKIDYYEALLRKVKRRFRVQCHSFSASEIWNMAQVSGLALEETI